MLIDAYMNHGRWVADCSTDDCGFSTLADEHMIGRMNGLDTLMFCPAHGAMTIRLPAEWKEIEAELNKRPVDPLAGPTHANWRPGETVGMLRSENAEHGVGV